MTHTTWHNFPALALENEDMRIVIVPNLGAKIVSLFDKQNQREWLVPPIRPVQQTVYAADFVSQDMSGWDEMLPTIVACDWNGVHLPDHGEVWSIPWRVDEERESLSLSVDGVALPYHLTRSAVLTAPATLRLRYSLTNTGPMAFPYLWAAHPQFAVNENTRIVLPPDITHLVNVIDKDPRWGQAGENCEWPLTVDSSGQTWRLDRVGPAKNHTCRKFYLPPEKTAAWAALIDEKLSCQMRLDWSPDETPYLGLWVDEGAYNTAPVVALEPSSSYYDSLELALLNRRTVWLKVGETARWELRVSLRSLK